MKKTLFAFLIGLIAAAGITSCTNDDNNTSLPASAFGLVNASPDAVGLDVYLNGGPVVRSLPYGTDTGYYTVLPGTYTLSFTTPSSSTSLLDANVSFAPGVTYSVFAIDSVSNLKATVVVDSFSIPSGDTASIRFFNFSSNAPAVDVALSGNVVFSNRTYNDVATNTGVANFIPKAPGTYTVELRQAGTSTVLYSTTIILQGGKVYTLYAKGFVGDTGEEALSVDTVVHNQ